MSCSHDFWHVRDVSIHKSHSRFASRGEITNIVLSAWTHQHCWDITEWNWILLFHSLLAITEHFWHVWKWKHSWERVWWVKISPFIQGWSPFTDSVGEVWNRNGNDLLTGKSLHNFMYPKNEAILLEYEFCKGHTLLQIFLQPLFSDFFLT